MKIAMCLLVAAIVWVGFSDATCIDGEVSNDGCNTCVCRNGVKACTLKFCVQKPSARTVKVRRSAAQECTPHDSKKELCNDCTCTTTGLWACTKRMCNADDVPQIAPFRRRKRAAECNPKDSKTEGCNKCTCTETGVWICTKKQCNESVDITYFAGESQRSKRESSISEDLKDVPCAPNDFFKIDCNTCYCNLERSGYLCTENTCGEIPDSITDYRSTTSIPIRKGARLLIFNERHEILRRIEAKDGKPAQDIDNDLVANLPTASALSSGEITSLDEQITETTSALSQNANTSSSKHVETSKGALDNKSLKVVSNSSEVLHIDIEIPTEELVENMSEKYSSIFNKTDAPETSMNHTKATIN